MSASRRLQQEQAGGKGPHLFTMGISGEIRASKLQLEPDAPDRPDSYRLGVTMELVMDSLKIQVPLLMRLQVDDGTLQCCSVHLSISMPGLR